jgi:hypothetical protein
MKPRRFVFLVGLQLGSAGAIHAQSFRADDSPRQALLSPPAIHVHTRANTPIVPVAHIAEAARSVRGRRLLGTSLGLALGGALGAIAGNQYAIHNRWFCAPNPGGSGCNVSHDYSSRYRAAGVVSGALLGGLVGLAVTW